MKSIKLTAFMPCETKVNASHFGIIRLTL